MTLRSITQQLLSQYIRAQLEHDMSHNLYDQLVEDLNKPFNATPGDVKQIIGEMWSDIIDFVKERGEKP